MSDTLANYALIKPLLLRASGFAPQLYVAQRDNSKELVVVKLVAARQRNSVLDMFKHEIHVMQLLEPFNQHNYWVALLGYGQDYFVINKKRQKVSFIVMPYYHNGNLAQSIKQYSMNAYNNKMQIVQLFNNMLDSIDALHQQGWLHLDIKPSNFLCSDTQTLILTDFGLAQPMINESNQQQKYTTQGTPKYMSPEQFLDHSLTPQTDYYALGLILYELLMHKPAYQASSYHDWAIQHCQQAIPLLSEAVSHFQWLIDGLLAKKPENRFTNIDAIKVAIKAAIQLA